MCLKPTSSGTPAKWRVMGIPDDGSNGPHQFVIETAGEQRWRELLGVYLPRPRWRVRVATFVGDVADRAEEWLMYVSATGEIRNVRHTVPEAPRSTKARRGSGRWPR